MPDPLFDDSSRGAVLSDDGRYRYDLWRRWGDGPRLGFIMLNPSIADATVDDKTVRRCIGFARRDGYAGIVIRNLFAYRTPKPAVLKRAWRAGVDVVGPDNDSWLTDLVDDRFGVPKLVAAWGASGPSVTGTRIAHVQRLVVEGGGARLWALQYEGRAAPHPLYLPKETPLGAYANA